MTSAQPYSAKLEGKDTVMRFNPALAALFLCAVHAGAGGTEMRQDGQGRWVNEAGGNPLGDSRFNLMADPTFNLGADPAYNSDVDPRFNLQADPTFNPRADPKFNPMGDPAFGPAGDGGGKQGRLGR